MRYLGHFIKQTPYMGVGRGQHISINRTFFQFCPQFNHFIHSFWGVIHTFRLVRQNDSIALPPIFSRLYAIFLSKCIQCLLNTVQIAIEQAEALLKMGPVEFQLLTGVLPGLNML